MTAPEIVIRVAGPSDIAAVGKLARGVIRTSYAWTYPPGAIAFFLEYHSDKAVGERIFSGTVLLAEMNGEAVGTGSLVGNEICGVFVRPDMQGRGIGGIIMDRLESVAGGKGIGTIILSISLVSRAFYEKKGYTVTRSASIDVGSGERLDYWEALKAL